MNRILNRQTTWHVINIKARREQNTNHYVEVFRRLFEEDPLVTLPRDKSESIKSMVFSEELDDNSNPKWIRATLLYYTIIDPEAFYNRRSKEDVNIDDWNADIVANKKEAEFIFIPSAHTIVIKRNSPISLQNTIAYFSNALNRIEPNTFDVSVVLERDMLDRILSAHAVYTIEANISYSNPGHTNGFMAAFDNKLRDMEPENFTIIAKGSKDHPLINEPDGMLQSIVNSSERDGTIKATIESTEGSKLEKIDSKNHPRILIVPQIINDIYSTLYNKIRTVFPN